MNGAENALVILQHRELFLDFLILAHLETRRRNLPQLPVQDIQPPFPLLLPVLVILQRIFQPLPLFIRLAVRPVGFHHLRRPRVHHALAERNGQQLHIVILLMETKKRLPHLLQLLHRAEISIDGANPPA